MEDMQEQFEMLSSIRTYLDTKKTKLEKEPKGTYDEREQKEALKRLDYLMMRATDEFPWVIDDAEFILHSARRNRRG
eukprot:3661637-Rhodomonas_salina.1